MTDDKTYRHHYVCQSCRRRHEHRTRGPRPEHEQRECSRCGEMAPYRYTNFVGDDLVKVRANYSFNTKIIEHPIPGTHWATVRRETRLPVEVPPDWEPADGRPIVAEQVRAQRQAERPVWIVRDDRHELLHALDLIEEVMGYDKGMGEEDWVEFCNKHLPFMQAHGRQKGTAGWS